MCVCFFVSVSEIYIYICINHLYMVIVFQLSIKFCGLNILKELKTTTFNAMVSLYKVILYYILPVISSHNINGTNIEVQ